MPPDADVDALFVPDGDELVPTELARGPWSPEALHGGAVAAAVARSVDRAVPGDDGLALVRVSLDLVRPVGTAPLTAASRVVRPGRRVQVVDTVVSQGGTEVTWGRSLRIRVDPTQAATVPTVPEDPAPDGPASGTPIPSVREGYRAFHTHGMEIRFVRGRFDRPGPATAWFRLRVPVVAGEPTTPVQRAVAAADFGNGVGAELDFATASFVNPDLTVSLHRPPVGEWVCVDTRTRFGSPGIGAAESALWDGQGRIGRAVQDLLVESGR
jgi:acyl-coenzyme A thioesterase PaaI-like protein